MGTDSKLSNLKTKQTRKEERKKNLRLRKQNKTNEKRKKDKQTNLKKRKRTIMPYLPRLSFAEKRNYAVINKAPEAATFDNLRAICMGVSTFKFPMHVDGVQHNEIIPGLYLGEGPLNTHTLQKIGVKRVLEIGGDRSIKVTDKCRNPFKDDDMKYMSVKVEDNEQAKIFCYFEECAKFIERGLKSGAVYVFSP